MACAPFAGHAQTLTPLQLGALLSSSGPAALSGGNTFSKAMTSTSTDCDQCILDLSIQGSGTNGPATAQNGLLIHSEKAGWYSGAAQPGEIDPLQIYGRQGGGYGAAGATTNADMSGILVNIQARTDNIGFANDAEMVTSVFTKGSGTTPDTITHQIDAQIGAIYVPTSTYDGYVANSNVGMNTDAFLAQSGGSGSNWTNLFHGTASNTDTFIVTATGDITVLRNLTQTGNISQTNAGTAANSLQATTATTLTTTGQGTFNTLSAFNGTVTVGADPNGGLTIGQPAANSGSSALTGHLDLIYNPAGSTGASQSGRILMAAQGVMQTIIGGTLNHYDTASGTTYVVPVSAASLTVSGAGRIAGGTVSAASAAYTLAASDCGTKIRDTGTAAHTYTVPTGLPAGCQVDVIQAASGGTITFAAGTGETIEQAGTGTLTHATTGQFAKATVAIDSASTVLLGGQAQ